MKKIYTIATLILFGFNANAQCGINPVPLADFSFSDVCLNQAMNFNDASTVSSGSIASWSWNFGDGNPIITIQNPNHTYSSPGTYSVDLIVTTNSGCKDTIVKSVEVYPFPIANAGLGQYGCSGEDIMLAGAVGGGATSGTWSGGTGTYFPDNTTLNAVYTPSSAEYAADSVTLTLTTNDPVGPCTFSSSNVTFHFYPNPVINFIADDPSGCSIHCANFTDLTSIGGGDNIADWNWDFGDGSSFSTVQNPSHCFSYPGFYDVQLIATSNQGCASTLTITHIIEVDLCTEFIWPGDADNNTIVDNNDILPIGLYYGQTGIPRASISNLWQADSCTNWGINENNGTDMKHADCNGDGIIDVNDTLAISQNFNLTHFIPVNNTNNNQRTATDLYFITNGSSFNAGDWVDAELWLGSSTNFINNLYGIAFNINYDASLVQAGTESITYPASWLGAPGTNAIKISKVDATANIAYGALTRIDHSDVSGYGKIADFKFQIKTLLTSPVTMPLYISTYKANNAAGIEQTFTTSVSEINKVSGITVYPNPFSSQTNICFNQEQKHSIIKIMDVLGKEVRSIDFSGKYLSIEKGEMKDGIYFLQVIDENKNLVSRKIIIR